MTETNTSRPKPRFKPEAFKKYNSNGERLTNCCGSMSTFHDEDLCCKSCFKVVSTGEGDGTETI
tara:strand:- start:203 stop:394 length:192 start_codon:yes stop_codon:yes gene_type:complete